MPQGHYTIEQWTTARNGARAKWAPILNLPFGHSLTDAENALAKLAKPGLYRVIHTQRVIWVEKESGRLRLRKSHAASPEGLDRIRRMFERCAGEYPAEEAREARRKAKKDRAGSTTR